MIHVEIPFRVDFHNGYCHGGAWFEGNYVANENAPFEDESNRFIFQLQTWLELGDYHSSTQASQPTSVGECTITPKLNMQYKYFAHERPLPGLDSIAIPGDFNGTGWTIQLRILIRMSFWNLGKVAALVRTIF